MANRREFLQVAAGTAGLLGLHAAGIVGAARAAEPVAKAGRSLKILVLGGTGFIGPHEIEHALARGHQITVFNRGRKAGLYGNRVEEIVGNRDTKIDAGLKPLEGDRTWDVVIDNSGYVPRHVRDAVELLGDRCGRYLYVSTVAVYDFAAADHFDEDGPLAKLADPTVEEVTWETYGPLKAACDRIVRDALGAKATVVRPTYIIGPGDTTDRFTYWTDRIHRGGDIVGPANADVAVQFVDVRDLCPWMIRLAEKDHGRHVQRRRLPVDPGRPAVGDPGHDQHGVPLPLAGGRSDRRAGDAGPHARLGRRIQHLRQPGLPRRWANLPDPGRLDGRHPGVVALPAQRAACGRAGLAYRRSGEGGPRTPAEITVEIERKHLVVGRYLEGAGSGRAVPPGVSVHPEGRGGAGPHHGRPGGIDDQG